MRKRRFQVGTCFAVEFAVFLQRVNCLSQQGSICIMTQRWIVLIYGVSGGSSSRRRLRTSTKECELKDLLRMLFVLQRKVRGDDREDVELWMKKTSDGSLNR
jgi:hypothetical protein